MRTARIYYAGELNLDLTVTLPQETSHYLLHVLRLKIGTNLLLFNGSGGEFLAQLTNATKKNAVVSIKQFNPINTESACKIHLAQAVGKGDKMDWIIQKAVELGVNEITPLITEFTNVRLDEDRAAKRHSHWQDVIISACEQSQRTHLPVIHPIMEFTQFINASSTDFRIYCHPNSDKRLNSFEKVDNVTVLIGPEGGLSEKEVQSASRADFIGVSLGPRILRMETAAVATVAILQAQYGDL